MKLPQLRVSRYKHSKTSRWVVSGFRENGKRARRFFETKDAADEFRDRKQTELVNSGVRAMSIPDSLRDMAAQCAKKLKKYGVTIQDATDYFVKHLEATKRSISVEKLIKEFILAKHGKGISPRYEKDLDNRLERFSKDLGARNAATITTVDVDTWIKELFLSAQSQNNYRAVISSMFSYAVSRGYAETNPAEKVEKAKVVGDTPDIFTPDEISRLLNAASGKVLPVLAIGAFAGLRLAEIFRLNWREVDLVSKYIHISAKNAKSAKRRIVKIEPNLEAWLSRYARLKGRVWRWSDSAWRSKLRSVMTKAKLKKWPDNGLRHSYASYHLAHFKNANALALEMGHADTSMIFAHYRELVRPEQAALYWQIQPAANKDVVSGATAKAN
jgi:integrase